MVSGEQKLFEAHVVRGAAIQRTTNLIMALNDAFRPVASALKEATRQFNHLMKVFSER